MKIFTYMFKVAFWPLFSFDVTFWPTFLTYSILYNLILCTEISWHIFTIFNTDNIFNTLVYPFWTHIKTLKNITLVHIITHITVHKTLSLYLKHLKWHSYFFSYNIYTSLLSHGCISTIFTISVGCWWSLMWILSTCIGRVILLVQSCSLLQRKLLVSVSQNRFYCLLLGFTLSALTRR